MEAGSVLLFLAGLGLTALALLSGGLSTLQELMFEGGWDTVKEQMEEDYQNTDSFRWYAGDKLEELLSMAVGGEIWENYGVSYDSYDSIVVEDTAVSLKPGAAWPSVIWSETPPLETESAASEAAAEPEYFSEEEEDSPKTEEERLQEHQKELAKDTNLLYQIYYQGELLFTNAEGMDLDGPAGKAPEGYSFLLYFDGEKTHICRYDQEEDIYGDGWYDPQTSEWYVPGYTNFHVDEKTKDAQVVMAAAENPRVYVEGDYGAYGTRKYGNRLYWMAQSQHENRRHFIRMAAMLFLGLALLVVTAVFFRRQKKSAELFLADRTKRCWLEVKLLAAAAVLYFPLWAGLWNYYGHMSVYLALMMGILLLYLLYVDIRYNWGRQKSLFKSLLRALRTKEFALPVQKRMVRKLSWAVCSWAAVLLYLLLLLLITFLFWWSAEDFRFAAALGILLTAAAVLLTVRCFVCYRKIAGDIGKLDRQVERIRDGNLTEGMELPKDHDLAKTAEHLNDIQAGMNRALAEQMKSERMKVELVSNVSHDIKTPLTSIISYVELLKQEEDLPDHVKDYIQILARKSERLKTMVQDVFEVSKAASGQLPVDLEALDLKRLMEQTLADMDERVRASGMTVKAELPAEELMVRADGQRMYRVFQNLIGNALQYSLPGSRIYISILRDGDRALTRIQNTSEKELDPQTDYTGRFVRGDESRTDGGSGLGLSIARSFTEACGGSFDIELNADLFTAKVRLPLAKEGSGA